MTTMTLEEQNVADRVGVPATRSQPSQPPVPDAETPLLEERIDVLEDGTPYMTFTRLARLCHMRPDALKTRVDSLSAGSSARSSVQFRRSLEQRGYDGDSLYFPMLIDGTVTDCVVAPVFLTVLEYFAFETSEGCSATARENFLSLSRTGGRVLIVHNAEVERSEDRNTRRLLQENVPSGYFAVFGLLTGFEERLIASAYRCGDYEGFDGQVAIEWAKYWVETPCDQRFGKRLRHPHQLPPWIPQPADPVFDFVYPTDAMMEFDTWLENEFIPANCPELRGPGWL